MDLKNIQPLEDFDWNAIGKKKTNYSKDEEEKLNQAYEKTFNQINLFLSIILTSCNLTSRSSPGSA